MNRDSRFQLPDSLTSFFVVSLTLVFQSSWPSFEPLQPELLGAGGTFVNAWADFDLDDDADLFVGFNGQPNRLYRNDKGTLTNVAAELGLADARPTRAAAWGDYDGDGDADLLLGFAPGDASVLRLLRNDRSRFVDVTDPSGLTRPAGAVRQPVWVDFDGDGDLDLFVAFRDGPNAMFRSAGGRFDDVAAAVGLDDRRRSVGAVWFDADGDQDLDLFVANMDGDANGFFLNHSARPEGGFLAPPASRFEDVAEAAGLQWGGRAPGEAANGTVRPCAADVDNDGRLDLFMANYGPNGLFLNRGEGRWEDVSQRWGVAIDGRYDTCAFADADHDGRLDLYVNGTVTGGRQYPDYLFRQAGQRFEDVTPLSVRALAADHGAAWADVDGNGAPDLSLTGAQPDGMHFVLLNGLSPEAASRSLFVRVDGRRHRGLPGATVRLIDRSTGRLLRTELVDGGSGYNAQQDLPLHFGLPAMGPVRLEVTLPYDGRFGVRTVEIDPSMWRGRVVVVGPLRDNTMTVR